MQNSKFEITNFRGNRSIRLKDKLVELSTPLVMGIVNATPDSFYAKSRVEDVQKTKVIVDKMINDGADILDIGGYSSRPGADNISLNEEIERVTPIIQHIHKNHPEVMISIDTFRSEVAKIAIQEGANIINDISGFSIDEKLIEIASEYKVPYILMHMRGTPKTMQNFTHYENLFADISFYFSEKIEVLKKKGVYDIIIDPGFGFSKTLEQNYELMDNLEAFKPLNLPILVGISRKSMIYKKHNITPEESLPQTIELNKLALTKGASILRVHDVKEAKELV